MGVTHRAVVVVGSKIDRNDVSREIDVRACSHDLPGGASKFCPECGREGYANKTEFIPAYSEDQWYDEGDCSGYRASLSGLPVFYDEHDDFILVAGAHTELDDASTVMLSQPDGTTVLTIKIAKRRLKDALEPLGLWDEDRFGIWLTMSCS